MLSNFRLSTGATPRRTAVSADIFSERDPRGDVDVVDDVVDLGVGVLRVVATMTVRLRISSERAHMSFE